MSKKILLIEDDTVMRENTAELLELEGYEVETAENGKYGVEKAKRYKPDLIICDIMMPELDGYGVLYLLSSDVETASIPFIFLTAKTERVDMRKGMEMGADDYLAKPFNEEELYSAIDSRLKRKEAFQHGFENTLEGVNQFLDQAKSLEELLDISDEREISTYKKGSYVFQDGAHPKAVYYVVKGKVKVFKSNEFAKELVTELYGKGDFFGYDTILEGRRYSEFAEVMEDSEIMLLPKDDFLALVHKNRDVSSRFLKMLANNVYVKEEKMMSLAYDSVRKKTAEAILQLKRSFDKDEESKNFEMAISRAELANIAGTATESLIRALADLKEDGLISVKGKSITVIDAAGLEELQW